MGGKGRKHGIKRRIREVVIFILVFAAIAAVVVLANKPNGRFNWYSTIFADKAGYYIYLPATLFFDFNPGKCPAGMDEKTGWGFYLDHKTHKIQTQYFYGVSLMLSPFFLTAHWISILSGQDEEGGFSLLYHQAAEVAGAFYLTLGLFFLYKFLKFSFRRATVIFTLVILFLGTNLLNYGVSDTLMSHIYSFAAISVFLYTQKLFNGDISRYRVFLVMCLAFAFLTVVRPTNMLIGLAFFLLDARSGKEVVRRIRNILRPKYILVLLPTLALFILPQLFYYNYLNGSFFKVTYGSGFTNWNHPLFAAVWFSPLNGFFLFNPVLLCFLAGLIIMIWRKRTDGWFITMVFLIVSYIAAAYSYWYFGCSSGHRAFVEYYPLLAIPLAVFLDRIILLKNIFLRSLIYLFIILVVYFNVRMSIAVMTHQVEKCFTGSTWDWDHFVTNLSKAGIYEPQRMPQSFLNDFENGEIFRDYKVTYNLFHSRGRCMEFDTMKQVDCQYRKKFSDFKDFIPRHARVSVWCWLPDTTGVSALLVSCIEKNGKAEVWKAEPINHKALKPRTWTKIASDFKIPRVYDGETIIQFYVWNISRKPLFLDDLEIRFE